jgi:hypothetical protein
MKHFTIDVENNITVHASRKAAPETGAGVFATEEQLADLIGPDTKRLVEIWNSLPGVKPATKFAYRLSLDDDRMALANRILRQMSQPAVEEPEWFPCLRSGF